MGGSSNFRGALALASSLSAALVLHCMGSLPLAAPMRLSELLAKQGLEAPDLTTTGSAIRNVLMVSMGSGYCWTGRDDWRGELPRYLTHFMPKASSFIVHGRRGISKKCRACLPDITSSGESTSFTCSELMHKKPDLIIVFGTGIANEKQTCDETQANWTSCAQSNYPSLMSLQKAKLLSNDDEKHKTITVHFPVRKISELYKNPFGFTHVVSDDSYFKPVAYDTAAELSTCAGQPKDQTLVYVARYTPHKGQVEFVQRLDPRMLGNYTLHFYGGEDSSNYAKLLKQEIKRTGIRAVVHGRVAHDELLSAVCRSAGQIHTALMDNNPRVAYEALFAGNPLFISKQSKTPGSVLTLPFVQATDMSDPGSLQTDFADFLSKGLNRPWESSISKFANTHMNSLAVYRQICESIGICRRLPSRKRVPANTLSSPTSPTSKKTPNAGMRGTLGQAPVKLLSSKHNAEN